MINLGEKIKKMREERELSQKDVADSVAIDRGQYSRIETGKVEPMISTLEKIAQAFDVELITFFETAPSITVDSFDKTLVERVKIIDELESQQKNHIYAIIDMAVANNRLKNTLTDALNTNFK